MGKQLTKVAGMRTNTRRQRSGMLSQHQDRLSSSVINSTGSSSGPRILEADRTLLTLKLQRDELTMYKGRLTNVQKREEKILKKLLLEGKREPARVLLKKRRFQKYILEESERELTAILHQAEDHSKYMQIKHLAEHCIQKNSDTMKRIQMLLSIESVDDLLLVEASEGQKKMVELDKLLLLSTVGERRVFDKGLDTELDTILKSYDANPGGSQAASSTPSEEQVAVEDNAALKDEAEGGEETEEIASKVYQELTASATEQEAEEAEAVQQPEEQPAEVVAVEEEQSELSTATAEALSAKSDASSVLSSLESTQPESTTDWKDEQEKPLIQLTD